jgi:D-alanyl-D-alanine carboxypeptidase
MALVDPKATSNSQSVVAKSSRWLIQIGTADTENKAKALLVRARAKFSKGLSDNAALAEKAMVGNRSVWRARFSNFSEADAQETCKILKKAGIGCFVTRGS